MAHGILASWKWESQKLPAESKTSKAKFSLSILLFILNERRSSLLDDTSDKKEHMDLLFGKNLGKLISDRKKSEKVF